MKKQETILKRRNYVAQLPTNFYQLFSLMRMGKGMPHEIFMIRVDKIYFSGAFSKNWLKRQFQKALEYLFPIKYKLTYFSYD